MFKISIAGLHALVRYIPLAHGCRNDCVSQLGSCTSLLINVLGHPVFSTLSQAIFLNVIIYQF